MASFCRSTLLSRARSVIFRSRTLIPNTVSAKPAPPLFPSPAAASSRASRVLSGLGSVESLMPLHSAVASARLTSSIAVDSTRWSWLSLGFSLPL